MANTSPLASVIVLNYNGAHYLPICLDALQRQSIGCDAFDVIVADNGSTDDSLTLLRERYPWVRVLALKRNFGFAAGNNAAIKESRGQYVVLLNNDTAPTCGWLEQLVAVAKRDPQAGLVTGRLQLFYDQIVLTLQTDATADVRLFDVDCELPQGVVQFLDGFSGWQQTPQGQRFRSAQATAQLGVPVPTGTNGWRLRLTLAANGQSQPVKVTLKAAGTVLAELLVTGGEPVTYPVMMPNSIRVWAAPVVQNAGSVIFANGAGRDRGVFVRNAEAFYETDRNQYDQVEEVFAGCGGNLLMRRSLLADIGLLDDDLFMYYEDTDLSWRARLRGWKVLYAPQAIVRHIHCGSSQEWSPFFTFQVERNRLAMLLKNGTPRQVVREWGAYTLSLLQLLIHFFAATLRQQPQRHAQGPSIQIRSRVMLSLLRALPSLLRKRWWIQTHRTVPAKAIAPWFQKIA